MRQRINLDDISTTGRLLPPVLLIFNVTQTGQGISAIDIHSTRSANPLATGPAEGKSGILFGFDFDECVENHGTAGREIDGIGGKVLCVCRGERGAGE